MPKFDKNYTFLCIIFYTFIIHGASLQILDIKDVKEFNDTAYECPICQNETTLYATCNLNHSDSQTLYDDTGKICYHAFCINCLCRLYLNNNYKCPYRCPDIPKEIFQLIFDKYFQNILGQEKPQQNINQLIILALELEQKDFIEHLTSTLNDDDLDPYYQEEALNGPKTLYKMAFSKDWAKSLCDKIWKHSKFDKNLITEMLVQLLTTDDILTQKDLRIIVYLQSFEFNKKHKVITKQNIELTLSGLILARFWQIYLYLEQQKQQKYGWELDISNWDQAAIEKITETLEHEPDLFDSPDYVSRLICQSLYFSPSLSPIIAKDTHFNIHYILPAYENDPEMSMFDCVIQAGSSELAIQMMELHPDFISTPELKSNVIARSLYNSNQVIIKYLITKDFQTNYIWIMPDGLHISLFNLTLVKTNNNSFFKSDTISLIFNRFIERMPHILNNPKIVSQLLFKAFYFYCIDLLEKLLTLEFNPFDKNKFKSHDTVNGPQEDEYLFDFIVRMSHNYLNHALYRMHRSPSNAYQALEIGKKTIKLILENNQFLPNSKHEIFNLTRHLSLKHKHNDESFKTWLWQKYPVEYLQRN